MNTEPDHSVASPPRVITVERLMRFNLLLKEEQARAHAAALEAARAVAGLTTPRRVQHFLGQTATETQGFTRLRENMRYRDPVRLDDMFSAVKGVHHARQLIASGPERIANCVYANRGGNGDEASGDGWRFRGGGHLQITFRENYRKIGEAIGLPLEKHPELLENPSTAALAAALYWKWKDINKAADADDTVAVTRLINPALAGLDDRIAWTGRARLAFP